MKSYALIFSVLLSSALLASASVLVSREHDAANRQIIPSLLRFLVTPKTITSTVTVKNTNLVVVGITTSCATSGGVLPSCRKRRSVMEAHSIVEAEDNEAIKPSVPIQMTATAYPEMRSIDSKTSPVMAVQPSMESTAMENTAGMAEVQIRDMDSICKARAANPFFGVGLAQVFGITVLYSTTVTSTQQVTVTSTTVASTNVFTIAGCLPSPLPFSICGNAGK